MYKDIKISNLLIGYYIYAYMVEYNHVVLMESNIFFIIL